MQFDLDGPAKVIKGEIHNILSIIRADPRYASPLRFTQEIYNSSYTRDDSIDGNYSPRQRGGHQHPLIKSLRELSDKLSCLEDYCYNDDSSPVTPITRRSHSSTISKSSSPTNSHHLTDLEIDVDVVTYVSPFATAVVSREISGAITGASLSSLHKFLLYGFISPESPRAKEGITLIARCIRHCTFEETRSIPNKGRQGFLRGGKSNENSSAALFSARDRKQNRNFTNASRNTQKNNSAAMNIHDEEVVMKLLSLSALVIRCEAGAMLDPHDVVGIFETCLHVSCHARNASSLLRSAAGDTLKHIVLVVFGRGSMEKSANNFPGLNQSQLSAVDYISHDHSNEDDEDRLSDDLWAEANFDDDESLSNQSIFHTDFSSQRKQENDFTTQNLKTNEFVNTTNSEQGENNSQIQSQQKKNITKDPNESNKNVQTSSDIGVPTEVARKVSKTVAHAPAFVTILHRLAQLACPRENPDTTCIQSLSLINIALETGVTTQLFVKYPALSSILQNDLCRHLLQLSTHFDLVILSLTLRVIFNLFNSIKNHLKIQLEVFLTSVHLRILNRESSSPEQKELALESLLEFCHEPALMHDLYMNYDCDMQCTNLFETICKALAKHASPKVIVFEEEENNVIEGQEFSDNGKEIMSTAIPLNGLNRLALEGILAVIESIARRCRYPTENSNNVPPNGHHHSFHASANECKIHNGNGNADAGQKSFRELIPGAYQISATPESSSIATNESSTSNEKNTNSNWIYQAREKTAHVLMQRKKRKHLRSLVVEEFNKNPSGKEWIPFAESHAVLPKPATAKSIASFLYTAPNLDKAGIGLYLSKGPIEKYPFNAEVCTQFVALFTFQGMEFSEALRAFLHKFKLPGEAQCIDRLMEAFAKELFKQQESENVLFKNSDAAFILAFATIMLNTDLHNPNMRDDRRMTLDQFIRTNRGLNGGEDFPIDFLTDLYTKIKMEEIQVQQDLSDCNDESLIRFDGLLSAKSTEVATPFFTPTETARKTFIQAGVHERDMFGTIFFPALRCISSVFVRSWDDILVVKALRGLQQMAAICSYFQMDEKFNEILRILLGYGRDYISSCLEIIDDETGWDKEEIDSSSIQTSSSSNQTLQIAPRHYYYTPEDHGPVENVDYYDEDVPIPYALLEATTISNVGSINQAPIIANSQLYDDIVAGSAAHRGLLSLHCAFTLVLTQTILVREAWPSVVESLFLLRDANALPPGVGDLDDFADGRGKILPQSIFARRSRYRVDQFFSGVPNEEEIAGFWGSVSTIFGGPKNEIEEENTNHTDGNVNKVAPNRSNQILSEGLVQVSQAAQFDHIFMQSKDLSFASQMLRTLLDSRDLGDSNVFNADATHPLFEHHAVFALELATRALLWNRPRASDLFPIFQSKVEAILLLGISQMQNEGSTTNIPFLMERAVITILRAFIHLYDIPQVSQRDGKILILLSVPFFSWLFYSTIYLTFHSSNAIDKTTTTFMSIKAQSTSSNIYSTYSGSHRLWFSYYTERSLLAVCFSARMGTNPNSFGHNFSIQHRTRICF